MKIQEGSEKAKAWIKENLKDEKKLGRKTIIRGILEDDCKLKQIIVKILELSFAHLKVNNPMDPSCNDY